MSRFLMVGAAAFAALISSPITTAVAQDDRDPGITVTGPRARITDQSGSFFNIYKVSASSRVYYGDLDLRTLSGRNELRYRVRQAAARSCNQADRLGLTDVSLSEPGDCMANALSDARPEVDRAFALYGG